MISIIIPSYNRAHFLPRALESIINQSYTSWEAIVVDDGSTDNTLEVVKEFISKDNRIKYIKKQNSGATHSRNVGVENSIGEYITFLDSDDEAKPHWLSSYYDLIQNGAEVMCCGFEYYDHTGQFIEEHLPYKMGRLYSDKTGRFTNGGVFILKKSLFQQIGGYDKNVKSGQHSEMAIRLCKVLEEENIEIKNLFIPLIKVHVHKGEKIRTNDKALFEGAVYVLKKHQTLFETNKKIYSDYLGVAAVSAVRLNKHNEAMIMFLKAWKLHPGNLKMLLRYCVCNFPILRNKVWNK